jgi:hypothetical protein
LIAAVDVLLKSRQDVAMRLLEGGAVLVDMRSGACFELNRTGVEVWRLLADGATMRSICDDLAARYSVARDTLSLDVEQLLDALTKQELVALCASPKER